MIPRPGPPIAQTPPDDPQEFARIVDTTKRYGGPRVFAERTAGTRSEGQSPAVVTPENTRSAGL